MKRIAVVGLGKLGIIHSSILNALPDVELTAVMDKDKGLRRYLYGMGIRVPFYQSLEEMLAGEKLDGVFVCVPSSASYSVVKACIERGINIFVEKPMCLTAKEAQDLIDLAHINNLKIMVGFVYLYSNEYGRIKRNKSLLLTKKF